MCIEHSVCKPNYGLLVSRNICSLDYGYTRGTCGIQLAVNNC